MAILLQYRADRMAAWIEALRAALPEEEIRVWPDHGDPADIEVVVTMAPERGSLRPFRRLRFIAATGAGVDALLEPGRDLPPGVPVVKLTDGRLAESMAQYVLAATMRYFRQFEAYERQQRAREWRQLPRPEIEAFPVGLLGLGTLGRVAAELLLKVDFPVRGWARTAKSLDDLETFTGREGLMVMLPQLRLLVCLLPLTEETKSIVDRRLLSRLPEGAFFINAGRGAHVVEDDLLEALVRGRLAHATLDVFATEPLPRDHPFWVAERITLTPHIASFTDPKSAARIIAQTLHLAREGRALPGRADPSHGY
jgi:glyoxylate/hydroxypyruvate reductase